jgi:hypothetical protein
MRRMVVQRLARVAGFERPSRAVGSFAASEKVCWGGSQCRSVCLVAGVWGGVDGFFCFTSLAGAVWEGGD